MIADLKIISCGKCLYSSKLSLISPILGKITAYIGKKTAHFKIISREKFQILPIFEEIVANLWKKKKKKKKKTCTENKLVLMEIHNSTFNFEFSQFLAKE